MNGKRSYWLMIGVVTLLGISIIAATYLGSSLLSKQSNKLVQLKLDSRVAEEQQNSLRQAKVYIKKYSELSSIAKTVVPHDKDQAQAVREIVKIAATNGVTLGSISFPSSTLGQSSAKTSNGPSTPSTNKTSVTQVMPVAGIAGVYVMGITVTSDSDHRITYSQLINFLADLEKNRRTAQVSSININPDKPGSNSFSFNLIINVYIKP